MASRNEQIKNLLKDIEFYKHTTDGWCCPICGVYEIPQEAECRNQPVEHEKHCQLGQALQLLDDGGIEKRCKKCGKINMFYAINSTELYTAKEVCDCESEKPKCSTCGGSGVATSSDEIDKEGCTNYPCPDCKGTGKQEENITTNAMRKKALEECYLPKSIKDHYTISIKNNRVGLYPKENHPSKPKCEDNIDPQWAKIARESQKSWTKDEPWNEENPQGSPQQPSETTGEFVFNVREWLKSPNNPLNLVQIGAIEEALSRLEKAELQLDNEKRISNELIAILDKAEEAIREWWKLLEYDPNASDFTQKVILKMREVTKNKLTKILGADYFAKIIKEKKNP